MQWAIFALIRAVAGASRSEVLCQWEAVITYVENQSQPIQGTFLLTDVLLGGG